VKAAVKLSTNEDETVKLVHKYEERAELSGSHSILKEAKKFSEELGVSPELRKGKPACHTVDGKNLSCSKIGKYLQDSSELQRTDVINKENWQGNLFKARWNDVTGCFAWLNEWNACPSNTVAGTVYCKEDWYHLTY